MLVGRTRELERLERALDACVAGRGSMLLLQVRGGLARPGSVCLLLPLVILAVAALGGCGGRVETTSRRDVGAGGNASNAASGAPGGASTVAGAGGTQAPMLISCTYKGQGYVAGDTFPEGDGCNTCTCTAHWGLGCTDLRCDE